MAEVTGSNPVGPTNDFNSLAPLKTVPLWFIVPNRGQTARPRPYQGCRTLSGINGLGRIPPDYSPQKEFLVGA